MFDPVRELIVCLPLGLYLLRVAVLSLRPRISVTGGVRETAWFGFGISGMMLVGPIALFAPGTAFVGYGAFAWVMLLAMYGLCVSLYVLSQPPVIFLYNASVDRAQQVLSKAIEKLGGEFKQAGHTIVITGRDVEVLVESFAPTRSVRLGGRSVLQSPLAWNRFERAIREAAAEMPPDRPAYSGWGFLLAALVSLTLAGIAISNNALTEVLTPLHEIDWPWVE